MSTNEQELSKKYTNNTIEAGEDIIIRDLLGNETTVNVKILNIDKEKPTLTLSTQETENTITVNTQANDTKSGINSNSYRYYIKEENGVYGTANNGGTSYTFTGLKSKTKYIIKVEVSDNAGNVENKEKEVVTKEASKIESTKYNIDEEKMIIKGITSKTTVSEIKAKK